MVDVDCAVGYTPCLTAADDSGYEIDEAEVIYWGRCPECVAATCASGGELIAACDTGGHAGSEQRTSSMSHRTKQREEDRRV